MVPYPVAIGQAKYPIGVQMFHRLAEQVGALLSFDAGALAHKSGSPLAVNMVLLGALAATDSCRLRRGISCRWPFTGPRKNSWLRISRPFSWGAAVARDPGNWQRRYVSRLAGGKIFVKAPPWMASLLSFFVMIEKKPEPSPRRRRPYRELPHTADLAWRVWGRISRISLNAGRALSATLTDRRYLTAGHPGGAPGRLRPGGPPG